MLAGTSRVQVLWSLSDREMSVNDLAEHVAGGVPAHHLEDRELRVLHEVPAIVHAYPAHEPALSS
jgi:ArsR family transcriptional regulator, zinc-responsive transcriptional repressor